jgi:hypothetical protein
MRIVGSNHHTDLDHRWQTVEATGVTVLTPPMKSLPDSRRCRSQEGVDNEKNNHGSVRFKTTFKETDTSSA